MPIKWPTFEHVEGQVRIGQRHAPETDAGCSARVDECLATVGKEVLQVRHCPSHHRKVGVTALYLGGGRKDAGDSYERSPQEANTRRWAGSMQDAECGGCNKDCQQ